MTDHERPPAGLHRAPRIRSSQVAMSDVARAAGVSKQTVSNVLRAPDRVSPATIDRVRQAIAQLDYHPNFAAQSLSSGRTNVIGYTVHPDDGFTTERPLVGFLDDFLTGLVRAASAADYGVLVTAAEPDRELDKYHEIIASHRVDAVVLSETVPGDRRAELLAEHDFPFVAFGRTRPGLPQTWVDIDNKAAMANVVDHLLDSGRRQIAYIGSGSAHVLPWVMQRRDGFRARLDKHGLHPASTAEIDDSNAIESLVHEALLVRPGIDAIVTDTDAIATDVMRTLRRHGAVPGQDVAVTGFNDFPYASLLDPPLTSVRIPLREIAVAVFARIVDVLAGTDNGKKGQLVDAPLIIRESSSGPPTPPPRPRKAAARRREPGRSSDQRTAG